MRVARDAKEIFMPRIVKVEKGGIAEELGFEVGDCITGFDGHPYEDVLDLIFYESSEKFTINVLTKDGEKVDCEVEKYPEEKLGIEFDDEGQLEPIRCRNKCAFCFVDQLPKGMRDSLYVKDDDYRLSFVSGNYVTLTNVFDKELERILRLHLSPLYVSVHCFDKKRKVELVANPEGAKLFEKMKVLAAHGIYMHTQIVLCKGINDGEYLDETLRELYKLHPQVASVAIVPVGLTGHREGLKKLQPIDAQCAKDVIAQVEAFDKSVGGKFCYCSDEFYLKAGMDVPSFESYGEFDQIENGVGLVASFEREVENQLKTVEGSDKKFAVSFITGQSFKGTLRKCIDKVKSKFPSADLKVVDIVNRFFGESITVAGLITATDIIAQAKDLPAHTVIPSAMLREFTDTFLDGMSVPELEQKLGTKLSVSRSGADLVRIVKEVSDES